jgi:magnesium chelatase subunit D
LTCGPTSRGASAASADDRSSWSTPRTQALHGWPRPRVRVGLRSLCVRDRVALIAFRVQGAVLVFPPTRSLVRAKRGLAGMPGGGGTPLAAGIDAAAELADALKRRGDSVAVVFLTDGRANVARNPEGGRPGAEAEAAQAARALRGVRPSVDTSPHRACRRASMDQMQAQYCRCRTWMPMLSGAIRPRIASSV